MASRQARIFDMKALPLLAIFALAVACGVADHVLGPTNYVVNGPWLFEETLADSAFGEFCSDHAHVTLTQDGPRFTGFGRQVGACTGTVPFPIDSTPMDIANGTIEGVTILFAVPPCPYTGTAYGDKPDSVAGHTICQFRTNGQTVRLSGTWHMVADSQP